MQRVRPCTNSSQRDSTPTGDAELILSTEISEYSRIVDTYDGFHLLEAGIPEKYLYQ